MSEIESLGIGLTADLVQFKRDLDSASGQVDAWAKGLEGKSAKLGVSADPSGGGGGGSLLPAGGVVAAGLVAGLGALKASVTTIGATISKQLNDAFKFDQARDHFDSIRHVAQHDLDVMRADFARFAAEAGEDTQHLRDRFVRQTRDMEYALRTSLLHGSASFVKGGLPTLDTFFQNASKTFKGKVAGVVDGAVAPMKSFAAATDRARGSMIGLGLAAGAAFAGLTLALKGFEFLKGGIKGASDLNETLSKTDVVLGDASTGVKKFADDLASRFGAVKRETLDVASGIGGLGKGLGGLSGKGLEDFTVKFTKLAADFQSLSNIPTLAEAGKSLQIGLSGEQSDVLKRFGLVMTDAIVESYAYDHAIAKVGAELTNQQKVMARAGLITKALADANGDLERTADSAANQWRKFTGTLQNLATSIGSAVLPAVNAGISILNEFVGGASSGFDSLKDRVAGFAEGFASNLRFVASVVTHWKDAFEVARLYIVQGILNIGEHLEVLGPNAVLIALYIGRNWKALVLDAFNAIVAGIANLWGNFQKLGTAIGTFLADPTRGFEVSFDPLLKGFEATAEKLPELIKPHLTDMSKEIAAAGKPILDDFERRQKKAQAGAQAVAKGVEPPVDAVEKAKKKKEGPEFAQAVEVGAVEGRSSFLSAARGGKSNPVPALLAALIKETQAGNALQRQVIANTGRMGGNPPRF